MEATTGEVKCETCGDTGRISADVECPRCTGAEKRIATPDEQASAERKPKTEREVLIEVEEALRDAVEANLDEAQKELLALQGIDHANCTTLVRVLSKMLIGMNKELHGLRKATDRNAPRIQVVSSMPEVK